MQDYLIRIVQDAATQAGVDATHIMLQSEADNLTIPRPRLEVQLLPEKYTRTGRMLSRHRQNTTAISKKELYQVQLVASITVFATDTAWLEAFCVDFIKNIPRKHNDAHGNMVHSTVQEATFIRPKTKRVGLSAIEVLPKVEKVLRLECIWRITEEQYVDLIRDVHINLK